MKFDPLQEANPMTRQRIQLRQIGPYVRAHKPFTVSYRLYAVWKPTYDNKRLHYVVYSTDETPLFVYDATGEAWYANEDRFAPREYLHVQNAITPEGAVAATIPTFSAFTLRRIIRMGMGVIALERLRVGKPRPWQDDFRNTLMKFANPNDPTLWKTRRR